MTETPLPVSPTAATLRAQDLDSLEADPARYLLRDRAASDALWMALTRPRDAVLRDWRYGLARDALIKEGVSAGLLDPPGLTLADHPSALAAIAVGQVAKAILGDTTAAELIFTRIEGSPGKRKGETDEGDRRAEMLQSLEEIVRQMNERPGDRARVINGDARAVPPAGQAKANGSGSNEP